MLFITTHAEPIGSYTGCHELVRASGMSGFLAYLYGTGVGSCNAKRQRQEPGADVEIKNWKLESFV